MDRLWAMRSPPKLRFHSDVFVVPSAWYKGYNKEEQWISSCARRALQPYRERRYIRTENSNAPADTIDAMPRSSTPVTYRTA